MEAKEKLKSNELRIGNLVYGVSDRVEKITYIDEENVKTNLLKLDCESQLLEIKDIEPIPLTEEWFLKFGFVYKLGGWRKDKIRLSDILEVLNVYYVNFNGCFLTTIKYVHQLQNLYFALTNEELTLNN